MSQSYNAFGGGEAERRMAVLGGGTLSVLATGYTGTAPCRVTMNMREVR